MVVLAPVAGVERCVALPVAPVAAGGMGNAPLQACQVRVSNDAQDAPATPPGGAHLSLRLQHGCPPPDRVSSGPLTRFFGEDMGRRRMVGAQAGLGVDGKRLRRRRPGVGGQGGREVGLLAVQRHQHSTSCTGLHKHRHYEDSPVTTHFAPVTHSRTLAHPPTAPHFRPPSGIHGSSLPRVAAVPFASARSSCASLFHLDRGPFLAFSFPPFFAPDPCPGCSKSLAPIRIRGHPPCFFPKASSVRWLPRS